MPAQLRAGQNVQFGTMTVNTAITTIPKLDSSVAVTAMPKIVTESKVALGLENIRIKELPKKPGYDIPIVRRAVLRYMLQCPPQEYEGAAVYVSEQRAKNPQWVQEVESLLNSEGTPVAAPPPKSAAKNP